MFNQSVKVEVFGFDFITLNSNKTLIKKNASVTKRFLIIYKLLFIIQ